MRLPICGVYFWNVAEKGFDINLGEDVVRLQVAEAVQKEVLDDFKGPDVGHFRLNQFPKSCLLTSGLLVEATGVFHNVRPILFQAIQS